MTCAHDTHAPLTRLQDLGRRLLQDESGANHIEYALIAVFVGTGLIGAMIALKDGLDTFFVNLSDLLNMVSAS